MENIFRGRKSRQTAISRGLSYSKFEHLDSSLKETKLDKQRSTEPPYATWHTFTDDHSYVTS